MQWKDSSRAKPGTFGVGIGKEALMFDFRARVCVKRASREFEDFRRDVCNGHVIGSRDHPFNMIEFSCQIEHCHPIQSMKEAKQQSRTTNRTRLRNRIMNDRENHGEALCDIGFGNNAGVVEDEDRKIDTGVVDDTFGDEKSKPQLLFLSHL